MRLKCPGCNAEMDLDVLLAHEEGRHVLAQLLQAGVPQGALLLRYIALFRPAKRSLAMSRTLALLTELWPDMQRGVITRRGRDWATTTAQWQTAIETVLAARDKGTLTLPLTGHGYLYEVLLGMVDKAEAVVEREREQDRQSRDPARHSREGGNPGAPTVTELLDSRLRGNDGGVRGNDALAVCHPREGGDPGAPTVARPAGPSLYARKLRAEIEAKKASSATPPVSFQPTQGASHD